MSINEILVSKNFILKEFECKDGSRQVVLHSELLELLQKLRDFLNRPVVIRSGYRNPDHNRRVGGSQGSYHLRGMAADITVHGLAPEELADAAEKAGFRGIGIYPTFVHVDIRKKEVRWKE